MSSDYEFSDNEGDYYDSDEMMDFQNDDQDEDDMEMDDYNDDFKISTGSKRKSYEVDHTSLSQTSVEKSMKDDVDHICGILGVEPAAAALLLRHQGWNKELLIERYMDDPAKVLVDSGAAVQEPARDSTSIRTHSVDKFAAGPSSRRATRSSSKLLSSLTSPTRSSAQKYISSPTASASKSRKDAKSSEEPESFVCPICFDDSLELKQIALDCGHSACSGCWNAYTISKIRDEGEHCIRCMTEGCAIVAPDDFVHNILVSDAAPDSDTTENLVAWTRFQEILVRNFVSSNPKLKFCPYPGCTNTVSCPSAASKSVLTSMVPIVSCGAKGIPGSVKDKNAASSASSSGSSNSFYDKEHVFCFGCPIESDHRPVVCGVARLWLKKCEDDSETANWIKSNTKECSKCQSTIEKNGGCNHMTCKKCKYEFCWVCMGPWTEHGTAWYSCNRYDEKGGVEARDAQSRSRASLERYLHYYNRWANHEQSAKLSVELYAKTEKKMEDMQITSELTWIEVQFMKKAVEEVEKCRMTLKWTYAMAYYLARGNEKDLFEDNQRDLEKAVEDLSELLESPIETENIPMLRQKVTDKTVYVQKRNEIVLEDTATGFQDGRWRWNVSVDGFEEPLEEVRVD
ncbi:RING-5 domain-containing protein [Lentinula aciculospora]|uniref:RBR-type E3 ubiquitin transferase n=1 Tax=Lentinula aciculospora TaxID=153920 RepID=A0A9W9AUK4_9AGAR|nr:RING-5 domain-containing protein [Lentinula aciculospora]